MLVVPPKETTGKDDTSTLTNLPNTPLEKSRAPVSIDLTNDDDDKTGETEELNTRQMVGTLVSIDLTGDVDEDDDESDQARASDTRQPTKTVQDSATAGPVAKGKDHLVKSTLVPFEILAAADATAARVVEEEARPHVVPTKVTPDELELAIACGFDLARRLTLNSSMDKKDPKPSSSITWELAAQNIRSMSHEDRLCLWKHLSREEAAKANASSRRSCLELFTSKIK